MFEIRNGFSEEKGVNIDNQMRNRTVLKIKFMESQSPPMEESRKFEGVEGVWSSVLMSSRHLIPSPTQTRKRTGKKMQRERKTKMKN